MTSALAERPALAVGRQTPTRRLRPARASEEAATETAELAASVGLRLDPWQQLVLADALGETVDGLWAAQTVGLDVTRQNGKGAILEARELAGLFLFGEQLQVHTAHLFPTALEAFRRVLRWVEGSDDLSRLVKRVSRSHGEEGIELRSGARLLFRARSGGAGRGFSGDLVVLDEAMILSPDTIADLMPTMSARANPQLWLTGSAGFTTSEVWQGLRASVIAGTASGVAWCGWEQSDGVDPDDRDVWASANPALGIRIPERAIEAERAVMDPARFKRERLGVWDPAPNVGTAARLDVPTWQALADPASQIAGHVWLAYDVAPDRSKASLAVAGIRPDGLRHVELVERPQTGTGWVPERVAGMAVDWPVAGIVADPAGPAGSLAAEVDRLLEQLGSPLRVRAVTAREHADAAGQLVDLVKAGGLRHLGQEPLTSAVGAAATRPLGEAWAWSRSKADGDISPLVAATLALWATQTIPAVDASGQIW